MRLTRLRETISGKGTDEDSRTMVSATTILAILVDTLGPEVFINHIGSVGLPGELLSELAVSETLKNTLSLVGLDG